VYPNRHTSNVRLRTSVADTLSGRGEHLVALNAVVDPMATTSTDARAAAFVVASDLADDPAGSDALETAFATDRGGRAAPWLPTPRGLARHKTDGAYLMVTWWDDEQAFRSYMRSQAHKPRTSASPTQPAKARGVGVRRFTLVAT
jgi:hypothetical protein